MKFWDILKLSFHSIYYNKVRTLITAIIIFVVSLLIMVISIIGLSFYESVNTAYIDLFDETGATFELSSYYNSNQDGDNTWRGINQEEYTYMMQQFAPYPELVDNIYINTYLETYYHYDLEDKPSNSVLDEMYNSNEFYSKYGGTSNNTSVFSSLGDLDIKSSGVSYLKSGRLWEPDDEGTSRVWVSEAFISKAASLGYFLEVGDYIVISLTCWYPDENDNYVRVSSAEKLRITGIFLNSALEDLNSEHDLFIDIITAYNIIGDYININNVYITTEPKIGYIFNQEYKKMNTIVKNINGEIEPSKNNNRTNDRFRCDIVENLQNAKIIGLVINGACVFICFIILLISIGSVANSVIISVDKNKRFFGVMMAVGLRNNGVKRIVQYESLIMIILSTGLAYGILKLFDHYFVPIIDFLMTLPGFTDATIIAMPIYIPIATIAAFIFMALLFARNSLAKIINMDVISVISEVN